MAIKIFTSPEWSFKQDFIRVDKSFPNVGTRVLGYFPYHTASIRTGKDVSDVFLPRRLFNTFEYELSEQRVSIGNKVVYICVGCNELGHVDLSLDPFALWLKDGWALIGKWSTVMDYDGNPLKIITKSKK